MEPLTAQDTLAHSADGVADNLLSLRALFPEAFSEGRVDMDVLRQLLGEAVDERDEKYGLNWHGKRQARQLALTPSAGTLRPAPADSLGDWDATGNLLIEGDNLEVLKLLQKSYAGQVKLIYIDPPYNTGKDFVYPDNFKNPLGNYLELTGQVKDGEKMSSNTEASGRFHTDWLNMMYPRLKLARNLLTKDGVIFISIDENEVTNLRAICDDIFGQESFLGCVSRVTGTPTGGGNSALVNEIDYVVLYSKSSGASISGLEMSEADAEIYNKEDDKGRYLIRPLRRTGGEDRREDRPTMFYPLEAPDGTFLYPIAPAGYQSRWICGIEKYNEQLKADLIEWIKINKDGKSNWQVYQKFYLDGRFKQPSNLWSGIDGNKKATREVKSLFDSEKVFSFPKPVGLIRHILQLSSNTHSNDIILDFFAGSGTTGHAVMAQNAADGGNRRYILVQLPEPLDPAKKEQKTAADYCDTLGKPRTIAELTKERLRRAARKVQTDNPLFGGDLGFRVYKLDTSNIAAWRPRPDDVRQSLFDYEENIKPTRTDADLLTELLLKLGLPLTTPIEQRALPGGHLAHSLGAGTLLVCLSAHLGAPDYEAVGQALVAWHHELAPAGDTQVLFRDSAFDSDVTKTNLSALLRQHIERVQVRSL